MRRALAGVVVEVEELVARERMAAQGEFNFLFVKLGGEFARDAGEVWRLCKKAVLFEVVPNGFQIDRAEDACVFWNLREVGKNITLADLVGEQRLVGASEDAAEIVGRVGLTIEKRLATHTLDFAVDADGSLDKKVVRLRRPVPLARFLWRIHDPETV